MHSSMNIGFDYYHNDIRLHNSQQAGEIARRLSREFSFSPGHIPKSNEKGKFLIPNSRLLNIRSGNILRHGKGDNQTGDELRMQEPELHRAMQQVYSQPTYIYHSSAIPEVAYRQAAGITLNDTKPQKIDEKGFQVNKNVMREVSKEESESHQVSEEMPELDPEEVAVKVYRLMCRDMFLERERGAFC